MNDLHELYKRDTGNKVKELEIEGVVSYKKQTVTFDLKDIPDVYFNPDWIDGNVRYMSIPDLLYIEWLENKVTEFLKTK